VHRADAVVWGPPARGRKSLRNEVHNANAVVWEPV
jgi:hypothetical protein